MITKNSYYITGTHFFKLYEDDSIDMRSASHHKVEIKTELHSGVPFVTTINTGMNVHIYN
jgi:hypothetical protein